MEGKAENQVTPIKVGISTQTFVCANCGGIMKYDINSGKFRCAACKIENTIETMVEKVNEYDFSQYTQREKSSIAFEGMAVVHCQNCGWEIIFEDTQIATTCPMCASSHVATDKQAGGIPPEGIVPFKVDKEEAAQKFKAWVKSRWFAPNDFKKKSMEGSLKGMYLPFWTYDANAFATYVGQGGKHRTKVDNEGKLQTVTDWFNVSGAVASSFDDVQVCASDKESEIQGILPFNTVHNTKPFSTAYLSGFHAELYSIKADKAFESAKKIMEEKLKNLSEEDIKRTYDEARVSSLNVKHSEVTYKHVLLPIWGSTFGYKGKSFNYFVNGETGVVDGSRPYSGLKIAAAIIGGIAVLATLLFIL